MSLRSGELPFLGSDDEFLDHRTFWAAYITNIGWTRSLLEPADVFAEHRWFKSSKPWDFGTVEQYSDGCKPAPTNYEQEAA